MALDPRTEQEIRNAIFGRTDYPPIITFFDHATYNEELTRQSGRPRYTEKTYTRIKPTHPDLKVRDEACHPTTEEEKLAYPEQWAKYQEVRGDGAEFKPPLQAVPGMRVSYFNELRDLGIFNADDLAKHDGDLDELNWMKGVAQQIMEISHAARDLREGRKEVSRPDAGQAYESREVPGGSVITPISGKTLKEEVTNEKANQEEGYTFTFTQSWG